jgi:5-methylcytosine-specific restriction endonuclease McrA
MIFNPQPKKKPVLLEGKDYTAFKREIYERDGGICQTCYRWFPLLIEGTFDVFDCIHLSHIVPRKKGGDVPENVKLECFNCHIEDGHLKWRSDKKEK